MPPARRGPKRRSALEDPEEEFMTVGEMLTKLTQGLKSQIAQPNLLGYKPHQKQEVFHRGPETGKLFLGGNRSGKTTAGVVEDLWRISGRHPYRTNITDRPVKGRCVASDRNSGVKSILLPEVKRWIVPSDLVNGSWEDSWHEAEMVLRLANGSFLEFKTIDQDLVKHAGTSRDFVHFDEEPPKSYFNENLLRVADVDGDWYITMTPVDGMTWIYDDLWERAGELKDFLLVAVSMDDNPHLSQKGKATVLSFLDEDERQAREHGTFLSKGGAVYKEFTETTHVDKSTNWLPPSDWLVYTSVDHGIDNPTAWYWHAVSPLGEVHTFHEHQMSEMLVKEHAALVLKYESDNSIVPFLRTGDPAMRQRSGITGTSIVQEYAEHGIFLSLEGVPRDVGVGVNKIKQYLKSRMWHVHADCPILIKQIKRLHWKTYSSAKQRDSNNKTEQIQKKDDHGPDSVRYFFTLMPDLDPLSLGLAQTTSPSGITDDSIASYYNQKVPAWTVKKGWDDEYGESSGE